MEKYSKAVREMYSQFKQKITEKYSKAVSEMHSLFKKKEAHPMERYIGRYAVHLGEPQEIVGYATEPDGADRLIIDASQIGGWSYLGPNDVVFKECEKYWYVSVDDLID